MRRRKAFTIAELLHALCIVAFVILLLLSIMALFKYVFLTDFGRSIASTRVGWLTLLLVIGKVLPMT